MKIAACVKISQGFFDENGDYEKPLAENLYSIRNKNLLLSRRLFVIPGTTQVKVGWENDDFINSLVTVLLEQRVRTWKEERRRRRLAKR